ncbi:hypothetical protein [Cereibacter sphaeroides]|uniref:hypothetical protein n=1 Tax=Cereibacter sphaeroides TaxID=1063 RepID=UPI001F2FFA6E|nr:hypothetical protein [Cereibacter sphaeroides]MCE6967459.1 hypothetical protein [Cereibacter sphaeroides]
MKYDLSPDAMVKPSGFRPFSGWALETASELEEQSNIRLVVPLFVASDLRRAAAFLALAAWRVPDSRHEILFRGLTPVEYVQWLLGEDPAEIAELLERNWRDPGKLALLGKEPLSASTAYFHPFSDRSDCSGTRSRDSSPRGPADFRR